MVSKYINLIRKVTSEFINKNGGKPDIIAASAIAIVRVLKQLGTNPG